MQPAIIDVRAVPSTFSPHKIVLHAGRTTVLRFANAVGGHGVFSPQLGIDHTVIEDGKTTEIEVTPRSPGTYELRCRIYCGPQHPTMILTIVVVP